MIFCFEAGAQRPRAVQVFTVTEYVSMFLTPGELAADNDDIIWFGSDDKLICFDGFRYTSYNLPANLIPYKDHAQLLYNYQDKQGTYWAFIANNGLYNFNKQTGQFSKLLFTEEIKQVIAEKQLTSNFLLEDSKNRLWFSLNGIGILQIDKRIKKQTLYSIKDSAEIDDFRSASWANKGVEVSDGTVYFGTNHGLVHIDEEGKISIYKDADSPLPKIFTLTIGNIIKGNDPHELIMCTWASGIKKFNTQTKQFKTYLTDKNQISGYTNIINDIYRVTDSTIFFVKIDSFANTGFGLFNERTNSFSYIKNLEPFYTKKNYFNIVRSGDFLWTLSLNQLYRFYIPALTTPAGLTLLTVLPANPSIPLQLYVSKIMVNEEQKKVTDNNLALKNSENNLRFLIGCKGATMHDSILFAYRLKGYETKWHSSYTTNIQYYNVKHGKYTLEVKIEKSPFVPTSQMLQLPITIEPRWWQMWWFKTLAALLLLCTVILIYRWRIKTIQDKADIKNEYEKKLTEVEMKALRAQMNPHFIFNCLNSINRYIVKNDHIKASNYLTRFSKLIRHILDNSASGIIPLQTEIETLDLYVQMEAMRFQDKFNYSITVSDDLDTQITLVPSMLVQPYVENAIWHGLLHKTSGDCRLSICFRKQGNQLIEIIIEDNGIGRKKAGEQKTKDSITNKSKGLQITNDRLDLIKSLYGITATAHIIDIDSANGNLTGTKVIITLPLFQNKLTFG